MDKQDTHTVAELAKEFSTQPQTIRKYIAFFDLPHTKEGRKTILPDDTVKFISEIIKLKANGMTLKQIKELMPSVTANSDKPIESKEEPAVEEAKNPQKSTETDSQNVGQDKAKPKKVNIVKEDSKRAQSKEKSDERKEDKKSAERTSSKDKPQRDNKKKSKSFEKKEDNLVASEDDKRLNRDIIGKEITNQARRVSKLQRFLGARRSPKEVAEVKSDLNRRYNFLAGLRYIRDNWLSKTRNVEDTEKRTKEKQAVDL